MTATPEELLPHAGARPERALELLRRRDFRRVYGAVCASELGDAFHYVALMWFALEAGGPLGVLAVRLADSIPAIVFGFHGGAVADRWDRRRTMVAADLARGAALVAVAAAGLTGRLPLWGLVLAAFFLTTAASYFAPAYGALLPALVGRASVQQANGLVRASADALLVGGWAVAAGLLTVLPLSAFFALNAASFFASAALLGGVRTRRVSTAEGAAGWAQLRGGIDALRPLPALAAAVVVLGVATTLEAGTWIVGTPELVRTNLSGGAGGFSLLMAGYAVGSIAAGAFLARRPVARKSRGSLLAWALYLPAYLLLGLAGSLGVAFGGAVLCGIAQGAAFVLVLSAAQEAVPDRVLGRVTGLITLVHRGAHASGLLVVSPLFAVFAPGPVFVGAAVALAAVGLGGAAAVEVATGRGGAARGRASSRSPRS